MCILILYIASTHVHITCCLNNKFYGHLPSQIQNVRVVSFHIQSLSSLLLFMNTSSNIAITGIIKVDQVDRGLEYGMVNGYS